MNSFCSQCGKEVPEGVLFCVNCGEAVFLPHQKTQQESYNQSQQQTLQLQSYPTLSSQNGNMNTTPYLVQGSNQQYYPPTKSSSRYPPNLFQPDQSASMNSMPRPIQNNNIRSPHPNQNDNIQTVYPIQNSNRQPQYPVQNNNLQSPYPIQNGNRQPQYPVQNNNLQSPYPIQNGNLQPQYPMQNNNLQSPYSMQKSNSLAPFSPVNKRNEKKAQKAAKKLVLRAERKEKRKQRPLWMKIAKPIFITTLCLTVIGFGVYEVGEQMGIWNEMVLNRASEDWKNQKDLKTEETEIINVLTSFQKALDQGDVNKAISYVHPDCQAEITTLFSDYPDKISAFSGLFNHIQLRYLSSEEGNYEALRVATVLIGDDSAVVEGDVAKRSTATIILTKTENGWVVDKIL